MKYKLPLLLILSLSTTSFCNEKDKQKNIVMRDKREDEIQAKKAQGEELTFDEELDDFENVPEPELERKSEPIPLTTKISNYFVLLAIICKIQYLNLKDYFGYSKDRIKRILGLNAQDMTLKLDVEEKKADIEQIDNDTIDEIDFD